MRREPLSILAALVAIVALAAGASSASAGDPLIVVTAAKHKQGPFLHSTQGVAIEVGDSKTLYWRVKNVDDDQTLHLRFDDAATGHPEGYSIRWFKGKTNISPDVKGDGYPFKLKAGTRQKFSARIKHKSGEGNIACPGGQAFGPGTNPDSAYINVNGICV